MLFPPKNLTVGLLDFNATAEWLPGQGNPPGTKYTLEYITVQNMYIPFITDFYSFNLFSEKCFSSYCQVDF